MKMDLKKAYDMVEWDFIEEVMFGFGFPGKFTELVMTCDMSPQSKVMLCWNARP